MRFASEGESLKALRLILRNKVAPGYTYGVYVVVNLEARNKVQARMKRIAGQIAGVQRMIDEDRYCVDILNQISAVRSALDAVGVELLTGHVESCVAGHGTGTEHKKAKPMKPAELLKEMRIALTRFLR
ncbi:MAG: metal-sensitive transcriptional regulator [Chthoniobacterales bacterium]